jgi:hypothetical protein
MLDFGLSMPSGTCFHQTLFDPSLMDGGSLIDQSNKHIVPLLAKLSLVHTSVMFEKT